MGSLALVEEPGVAVVLGESILYFKVIRAGIQAQRHFMGIGLITQSNNLRDKAFESYTGKFNLV